MGPPERGRVTADDTLARGRRPGQSQGDFWIVRPARRPAPAHPCYEPRNQILAAAGLDRFGEAAGEKFYAAKLGRPARPPGVYFRRLRIGCFEKRGRARQIAWRSRGFVVVAGVSGRRAGPGEAGPGEPVADAPPHRPGDARGAVPRGAEAAGRARAALGRAAANAE
jgi:hypothetical protein